MTDAPHKHIERVEELIDYTFKDKSLLERALTHRSYTNESETTVDNQRLEFLGDAVIGLVIAHELYARFPELMEGALSATRSSLVNDASLASTAMQLSLGDYILLGRGELTNDGRTKVSILADALEALVAATYLDGGMQQARRMVLRLFKERLEDIKPKAYAPRDYKSQLQCMIQQNYGSMPRYEVIDEKGPAHKRTFVSRVLVRGEEISRGEGSSKRSSQQDAARIALEFYLKELSQQAPS